MLESLIWPYEWLMSKSDPRTSDWPLIGSPFPIWSIILCYIYVVKSLGPRLMKNRPPMPSAGFFHYGGQLTYIPPGGNFSIICERVDYTVTDRNMRLLHLSWWLMILKMIEFLDTIFFVLRKKSQQISALHVTHHSLVPWGIWIGLKFGAGGHNAFVPLINLFVHMIMYSYYCLAAFGPHLRRYLWWKRYLTQLQMIQFAIAIIHSCIPLIMDCGFQPFFAYAMIAHAILFWIMFYNFYCKSYYSTAISINNNNNNNNNNQSENIIQQHQKPE
ncbi:Elongation of very long chain fatty acids protein 7 [Dermatophagoides farinae]|uniref:Elongation of very long chain fatty acids protein n=1 Tax=Dermatophagoides farinae TaxID=6954 RepID=A0A922HSR3_DERFA|nr:Elongation of very long chain fatty acids protein 7 [Dermatophagoides farinae]